MTSMRLLRRTVLPTKLVFRHTFLLVRRQSTNGMLNSYLVTPKVLFEAMSQQEPTASVLPPRIIPLCAAWFLPNDPEKRTGRQVFLQKRIPSARFFDLDAVKDHDSPYPHMLPTAEVYADAMSNLGIKREDRLVVYDSQELGIFSAPRVAWMLLKVFQHKNVHVLDNYRLWVEEGYPTETGEPTESIEKTSYPVPTFNPDVIASYREVKDIATNRANKEHEEVQIIDVRGAGRFSGAENEPRPGLSSGHMPGSINLPLPEILDPLTKTYLPKEQLIRIFESKGIDAKKPIIATCGTGVMAAALDAALDVSGFGSAGDRKVYDGSWTEYAQRVSQVPHTSPELIIKGR